MQEMNDLNLNSASWMFFVKACFAISLIAMGCGIVIIPVEIWVKGYLAMGTLLVIASSIMLSKTLRDEHEGKKIINRISEARTQRILKEAESL